MMDNVRRKNWKDDLAVKKLPFFPRHVIEAGIDKAGKPLYIVPSGKLKTREQLTEEELKDLQKYQPTIGDNIRT